MTQKQKWSLFGMTVGSLFIIYSQELTNPYPCMGMGVLLVVWGLLGCRNKGRDKNKNKSENKKD